ncbi:DUF2334 domain-containing protein [Amycolatopsis nigrescens]|uniref:DUF2334 domain-containing protein n=1 Tax=Amycolatopsis nigrescens TaxID=381445 RepID=UPI00039AAC50|nr:DUF2334 domain-containing protein [Amycolatopsis nigrescens]
MSRTKGQRGSGRRRLRSPAGFRLSVIAVVVLTGLVTLIIQTRPPNVLLASAAAAPVALTDRLPMTGVAGNPGPGGDPAQHTLVLYDAGEREAPSPLADGGEAATAEAYAMYTANLVSRSGAWKMRAAADYQAGEIGGYQAVVYVGTIPDALLPPALLADLAAAKVPVVWLGENVDKLFVHDPGMAARLGWQPAGRVLVPPANVRYKNVMLTRNPQSGGFPLLRVDNAELTEVLAEAVPAEGPGTPWAVRSSGITYLAEAPYSFVDESDRYLAAADILLGTLAPETPERHRALARIEDIGPRTDPEQIRRIADFLGGQGVPFSMAVYPYYVDPRGSANGGRPTYARLVDSPALVDALRYATDRGGSLIMHGYSHQFEERANPYDGASAADYEFYTAIVDENNAVVETGPVPGDSAEWFRERIATGLGEFRRVGLPEPDIFEFPHYGGSAVDYKAVTPIFAARYDQGSYYAGYCPRGECGSTAVSYNEKHGQYFPYPVRDVYGAVVVPENLDHVAPQAFNQHPPRLPQDLLDDSKRAKVVRDNVASFFFHPFLPLDNLRTLVDGLRGQGYQFTSASEVARG